MFKKIFKLFKYGAFLRVIYFEVLEKQNYNFVLKTNESCVENIAWKRITQQCNMDSRVVDTDQMAVRPIKKKCGQRNKNLT